MRRPIEQPRFERVVIVDQPRPAPAASPRTSRNAGGLSARNAFAVASAPMSKMLPANTPSTIARNCSRGSRDRVDLATQRREHRQHLLVLARLQIDKRIDKAVLPQRAVAPMHEREDRDGARVHVRRRGKAIEDLVKLPPARIRAAIDALPRLPALARGPGAPRARIVSKCRLKNATQCPRPAESRDKSHGHATYDEGSASLQKGVIRCRVSIANRKSQIENHLRLIPPSTSTLCPVMYSPALLHNSTASPAKSSGRPIQPSGTICLPFRSSSSGVLNCSRLR